MQNLVQDFVACEPSLLDNNLRQPYRKLVRMLASALLQIVRAEISGQVSLVLGADNSDYLDPVASLHAPKLVKVKYY